jgi:hypothetical protein
VYGVNTYENAEEQEKSIVVEEELDEDEEPVKDIERKVRKEDIFREMLLTSAGRDKIFVGILSRPSIDMSSHSGGVLRK